jgi:hypothetical protein
MSQTNKDAQKVAPETHSREANLKLANQAHGLQCAVEVAFGLTEVLDEGLSRFGTVAHPEAVKDVLRQLHRGTGAGGRHRGRTGRPDQKDGGKTTGHRLTGRVEEQPQGVA